MRNSKRIELKSRMVEELSKTHNVLDACSNVGLTRSTFYRWCDSDKEFANKVSLFTSLKINKVDKSDRFLWVITKRNNDKKWYQPFEPEYIKEKHYLIVKNGFVCLGGKVK